MSETKPLLGWCFPYETPAPIFLLPSPFLLSIFYYSHGSCSRLQMSGMFSSEQHKFSRLTVEAKERKEKNKPQTRIIQYFSPVWSRQQALQSFKLLCSHRKRTKPLSRSPLPAPREVGYLRPSGKPEVPREGECTDFSPTNWHSTLLAAAEQRREKSDQQSREAEENIWLHHSCASGASTHLARPSPRGRESRPLGQRPQVTWHRLRHHVVLWLQFSKDARESQDAESLDTFY